MAIDTAAKRLSIMDMESASVSPGTPAPDGSFTAPDRLHLLWLYSGISAGGEVEVAAASTYVRHRRRRAG